MSGTTTPKEMAARALRRHRRYENSVGRGFCSLTRGGHTCPDRAVRLVGDIWICQHHSDIADAIAKDAGVPV